MKIKPFDPKGIQLAERTGFTELLAAFEKKSWYGYSNFSMRRPGRGRERREIDLVIITEDRVFVIDLKHWRGKIENRGNRWFKDDQLMGRSPVLTIEDNAKEMATLLGEAFASRQLWAPRVEGYIVLTHWDVDFSGIAESEKGNVVSLKEFVQLADPRRYRELLGDPPGHYTNARPLCGNDSKIKNALTSFFSPGAIFSATEAKFGAGYRPEHSPCFEPSSKIYAEYMAELESDPNHTALLRLWDFSAMGDLALAAETRRPLADREHSVLGYISQRANELYDTSIIHLRDRDKDVGLQYWELFEVRRSTRRIADYVLSRADALKVRERMELVALLLSKVAELHRIGVAHRDLAGHSVWIEHPSRVFLSGFAAAHFPETETLGSKRIRLLASDVRLPEDISENQSTPFAKDVFLLGALCWTALTGTSLPEDEGVPVWLGDEFKEELGLPAGLEEWFERALDMTPENRFPSAVEMLDAFAAARSAPGPGQDFTAELNRYRSETDPYFDYPMTVRLKKGRANVWVSGHGDAANVVKVWGGTKDSHAAQLIAFLRTAETLKAHAVSGIQRVVEYGISEQGVFLVVRKDEGEVLSADVVKEWTRLTVLGFLDRLGGVVEALHEHDIAHGDLKPDNILVRVAEEAALPLVMDIPDFASASEGELQNAAYSPANSPSDPYSRDRYAVCKITEDLLAWMPREAFTANDIEVLRRALAKCANEEEVPYLSLRALRLAITRLLHPAAMEEPERVYEIVVPDVVETEDLLPDNGRFHVVAEPKGRDIVLRIVGVDQELRVIVDRGNRLPKDAKVLEATSGTVRWAIANQAGGFDGTIRALPGRRLDLSALDELIQGACAEVTGSIEEDARPETAASDDEEIGFAEVEVPRSAPVDDDALPSTPIAQLWETIIQVERSLRAEVTVAGKIVEDRGGTLHLIPYESGAPFPDFEPNELVHLLKNDRKIGILDVRATTPQTLAVRELRRAHGLSEGQTVQLDSNDDYASYQRRSKAVARILIDDAEIDNLISYFDPARKMDPLIYAEEPDDAVAKRYGLNEGQATAFKQLWTTGPVGLLQGPPGTGKTKFIASFIHYALTEGGMRNALVLSQSHEATNNAAEKVMELAAADEIPIEMVRVGHESKISERLLPHHSEAIQDRYRELFRAEMKSRVGVAARRIGLSEKYASDAFELEATLGDVVERLLRLSTRMTENDDVDEEFQERRLKTLQTAYEGMMPSWLGDDHVEPEVAMQVAHERLIERHRIRNLEAARRFKAMLTLGRDWIGVLSSKDRTLEDFLVRSRALVAGTCVGIGRPSLRLENVAFDLVVIDEAARCDPGELAVGMLAGKRILLVGDHKQLPPLYDLELADEVAKRLGAASRSEVTKSDFERIFRSSYGRAVGNTLNVQYRMAPAIGRLVSEEFYADEGLQTGRGDPPDWYSTLPQPLDHQISWIDTSGLGTKARERQVGTSFENRTEADIILGLLRMIAADTEFVAKLRGSLKEGEKAIGVICMYGAQKRLLRDQVNATPWPAGFEELIKIDSVDGYQGKENPIIILSITRNNAKGRIGHVESLQRMNVALSRAMERLVIVGTSAPFERDWAGNSLKGVLARIRGGEDGHALLYPAERLQEACDAR